MVEIKSNPMYLPTDGKISKKLVNASRLKVFNSKTDRPDYLLDDNDDLFEEDEDAEDENQQVQNENTENRTQDTMSNSQPKNAPRNNQNKTDQSKNSKQSKKVLPDNLNEKQNTNKTAQQAITEIQITPDDVEKIISSAWGKTPYDLVLISKYHSEEKKKEVMDFLKCVADQSMSADSDITVYATAGSMSTLTFQNIFKTTICFKNGKQISLFKSKYSITMSKTVIEIEIANVTANDTGKYKVYDPLGVRHGWDLNVSYMSCPTRTKGQDCAIEESTAILPFITDWSLCYNDNKVDFVLQLSFIGQTDIQTIVGQEGKEMTITCFSDTDKYITALRLELNGTAVALGDNQTVDFKFKPDRKDHLSRYKCEDLIQSSITIEVKLIVTYAPEITIRHTNDTIVCDYNGVPAVYLKRINHISQYGTLLRSMNMNNEAFNLQTEIPYQKNGKYECVVSNGIRDNSGNLMQTVSTNVKYEVGVNHQSTDESESFATSELPSNFQRTDAQEQRVSIPSSLSNVFNTDDSGILSIENAENCNKINAIIINNALSNKNSETSMESHSESSDNVMVGSDGDGYENPYETISQERDESHQYIMMSKERHNSFSSIENNCKDDILETSNAKEATYINLQF
ncbi:Hypothetical predicted protein [Mytilus galloprovincialis]|uniref:Ig-like domain-containing protein n=1 Tax=Mytilus galloprovincialis TaxID=29158 RepID=A0A8B6GEV6_MYTGA|nr:Hypothetical predicted protein [Mytilus galloprovincialis]